MQENQTFTDGGVTWVVRKLNPASASAVDLSSLVTQADITSALSNITHVSHAASATNTTRATNDQYGNRISTYYLKTSNFTL